MSRMTHLHIRLILLSALFSFSHLAQAEIDYNSVDITSLQNQYQRQLKPKTVKKPTAAKTAKRNHIKQSDLQKYQRLLANQQQQHNRSAAQQRAAQQQRARQIAQQRAIQQQQRARQIAQQRTIQQQQRARQIAQQRQAATRVPQQAVRKTWPKVSIQAQALPTANPQALAPRRDAIFEAASSGNVRLIGQLLNQGVNVNQANNERETALHMAAAKGHYSTVIYLLNHGANLHARTISNWQPIHHATRFRHAQIANYLKQRGSQIYAKTSDGMSSVDMARAVNDRRIMGIFGIQ